MGFWGNNIDNKKYLTNLFLRKEGLIVKDRIILGADYMFVLDSQFFAFVGDHIMVNLDNFAVHSDSEIMAHVFCDENDIYSYPALYAVILHTAHRVDCTIVHARVTTSMSYNKNRLENEMRFAQEMGFTELDFPYCDEETAMKILMDKKVSHEPYKARTIITRHRLGFIEHSDIDDKRRDDEWIDFNHRLTNLLESHKLTLFKGKNEEKEENNPFGFDESDLIHSESYEAFLSHIQVREFPKLLNDKPYESPPKYSSSPSDLSYLRDFL